MKLKRILPIVLFVCVLSPCLGFTSGWAEKMQVGLQDTLKQSLSDVGYANLVSLVKKFYQDNGYKPIWIDDSGWRGCAEKAIQALERADEEGLEAKDYEKAVKISKMASKSVVQAVKAEIQLTADFLQYIDDVRNGRFNPKEADKELVVKPEVVYPAKVLAEGVATGGCDWVEKLPPQYSEYKALKKVLAEYRHKEKTSFQTTLPTGATLEYRDKKNTVVLLRKALNERGFLDAKYVNNSSVFDEEVDYAVKEFQRAHDLEIDGVVGPQTLGRINMTPKNYVDQIIVSMERWRWMPRDPGTRHVKVNIARFELEAVDHGRVVIRSPIIVGRTYRETPVFSSVMYNIKFNPTWHVPRSIAVKDKLPKVRRDPAYLTRNGYSLYNSSGQRISPLNVDWHNVSAGNFNYRIKQAPGPNNALGKIRFSIKNSRNVYLHSTPEKKLFEKPVRTFSSGCIRVQNIHDLAAFAFNDPQEWPRSRIEHNMEGTRTKIVDLDAEIPVHVVYFTTWIDESGNPHFAEDVYGQDKQILAVLKKGKKSITAA